LLRSFSNGERSVSLGLVSYGISSLQWMQKRWMPSLLFPFRQVRQHFHRPISLAILPIAEALQRPKLQRRHLASFSLLSGSQRLPLSLARLTLEEGRGRLLRL